MRMRLPSRQDGFSLVEVVLALAIMAFCLIVLIGLLPLSLSTIKNASEETAGINILSTIVSDLKSTPSTMTSSSIYQLTFPAAAGNLPQVTSKVMYLDQAGNVLASASSAGARYRASVTLTGPSLQNTFTGNASVGWPAQAANPPSAVEVFFALNRN